MKKILLLIFTIVFAFSANSQFLTDLSPEESANMAKNDFISDEIQTLGFSEDLPSKFSLEKYAYVSEQKGSSCTGHALAGVMNIMYNYLNNITTWSEKAVNRFSPIYIYSSIKDVDDINCSVACACGTHIHAAVELIENYGCKKNALDPYLKCEVVLNSSHRNQMKEYTKHYSIDRGVNAVKWEKINEEWYSEVDINFMKLSISLGLPLIAGIYTADEFGETKLNYIAPRGPNGPHAVTIVGYDDSYNGGSFRVLNSYGTEWGDNGFFWITYRQLIDNFMGPGIYSLYNEDFDYSSWIDPIRTNNFYKGKTTSGAYYEGPIKGDNFHGTGILSGDNFNAIITYDNGLRNGPCIFYGLGEDDFTGVLYYEDDELIDSDQWGFADEESTFIKNNTSDINLSNSADDDTIEEIENIDNSSLPKNNDKKFNFNNTNSYGK